MYSQAIVINHYNDPLNHITNNIYLFKFKEPYLLPYVKLIVNIKIKNV